VSKFNHLKFSFKSGEWSPRALGRKDTEDYRDACRQMHNWFPYKTGGAVKRPGTQYRAEVESFGALNPAAPNIGLGVFPFVFNKNEAFTIVLSINSVVVSPIDEFIKIFNTDGTLVSSADIIVGADIAPTALGETYNLDPAGFNYVQVRDVLFITHSSGTFEPIYIARYITQDGSYKWEVRKYLEATPAGFGQISPVIKRPYRDSNIEPVKIQALNEDNPANRIDLRMLDAANNPIDWFNPGHVGAYFRIVSGAQEWVVQAFEYTSPQLLKCNTIINPGVIGAAYFTDNWQEQSWSDYRGWPRTVEFFDQRLMWGGNDAEKNKVWGSLAGNVFHMMAKRLDQDITSGSDTSGVNYFIGAAVPDTSKITLKNNLIGLLSDPISFAIGSQQFNPITWLSSGESLHVGTLGGEYILTGGEQIVSAESVSFRQNTAFGGDTVQPVRVDNETLFISRDGRKLRNFKFNDNNGSYLSGDVSGTADHLHQYGTLNQSEDGPVVAKKFKSLHYQQDREIVWLRTTLNDLVGVTYSPGEQASGWFTVGITDAENIWGVAYIPESDGQEDALWVLVQRGTGVGAKYYLESIGIDFDGPTLASTTVFRQDIPVYLDSAKLSTAVGDVTTISGLDHLEGLEVAITADGEYIGDDTVDIGSIDLPQSYPDGTRFVVGLKYTATLDTASVEAGGDFGYSEGAIKKIDRVVAKLYKTKGLRVGSPDGKQKTYPAKIPSNDAYTGNVRVEVPNSPSLEQSIRLLSEDPYPAHVVSLAIRGVSYD